MSQEVRIRDWRKRAEELRTIAEGMRDKVARQRMLSGAATYDEMADRGEAQVNRGDDAHQGTAHRWMHLAREAEHRWVCLAREAEHRTKNVLAAVLATIDLSNSDTPQGLKRAIKGRIQAVANVHALFVQSGWTGAELSSLAMQQLAPYVQDNDVRAHIDGPRLLLEPEMAQTMAVVLHELATNAAKYGALSVASGHVEVKWSLAADGSIVVRWTERGGPPVNPPTRRGFGTEMIEGQIRHQADGEVRWDWRPEGLTCEIVLRR